VSSAPVNPDNIVKSILRGRPIRIAIEDDHIDIVTRVGHHSSVLR